MIQLNLQTVFMGFGAFLLSGMFMANMFWIRRLIDKIDGLEKAVNLLGSEVGVIKGSPINLN